MNHTITDAEIEKLREYLGDAQNLICPSREACNEYEAMIWDQCSAGMRILDQLATQSKQAEQGAVDERAVNEAVEYLAGMGSFDSVAKQLALAAKQAMKKAPRP